MQFILKGKGWPSQDFKRGEAQRKRYFASSVAEVRKEDEATKDAESHVKMMREEDSRFYDNKGNLKVVDFREDPNAKDIIKIGDEVKAMKRGGIERNEIDKQLSPEVAKHLRHK